MNLCEMLELKRCMIFFLKYFKEIYYIFNVVIIFEEFFYFINNLSIEFILNM